MMIMLIYKQLVRCSEFLQERFNCRDFQQETRTVEWGLPCIWTCSFDNDPRKDKAVADYLRSLVEVVEVRDRPSERGWGKLYEAVESEAEEENSEWEEARAGQEIRDRPGERGWGKL